MRACLEKCIFEQLNEAIIEYKIYESFWSENGALSKYMRTIREYVWFMGGEAYLIYMKLKFISDENYLRIYYSLMRAYLRACLDRWETWSEMRSNFMNTIYESYLSIYEDYLERWGFMYAANTNIHTPIFPDKIDYYMSAILNRKWELSLR